MLYLSAATFFIFGIVLVLLGATQAALASDLALDLTTSGFLGAALALGLGAGVLVGGPLADRFARGPVFVGSCLVAAAGLLAVDVGRSYAVIVACILLIGLGCGIYETIVNAAIADRYRTRTASALAIVHSAATLGACVGPVLVQVLHGDRHWSASFHALGYAHCVFALCGGLASFGRAKHEDGAHVHVPAATWLASPVLPALAIVAFAYVGVENGLTLFAVPLAQSRAETESAGQWSISTFWLGLLVGRIALVLRPVTRGWSLLAANGIGGGLMLCAMSAAPLGPLAAATALAGLALGPVYPLMITLVAQRFPTATGTAVGLVASAGAAGGFAVPWLVGALGDSFGVRPAIIVLAAHAVLLSVAALALARREAGRLHSPL